MDSSILDECSQQCLMPCEGTTVTVTSRMMSHEYYKNTYIRFDNMNLKMYEEKYSFSFEKLSEIIGGIVGFLLGYSFYDMLCFAFIPIVKLFAFVHGKAKQAFLKKLKIQPGSNIFPKNNEL